MRNILVIAPHPDDETLGCGGTILKHLKSGDKVHWLIVTRMNENQYTVEQINKRDIEIKKINQLYNFSSYKELNYPPASLDQIPKNEIIDEFSKIFAFIKPDTIYSVFRNDAHSDHAVVFDATFSASKSFRNKYVKRLLTYETISETNFSNPLKDSFKPNVYVNIEDFIDEKIKILDVYKSEMGDFPFPRSKQAVKALANTRGVESGCTAAEAFMLIKEIL